MAHPHRPRRREGFHGFLTETSSRGWPCAAFAASGQTPWLGTRLNGPLRTRGRVMRPRDLRGDVLAGTAILHGGRRTSVRLRDWLPSRRQPGERPPGHRRRARPGTPPDSGDRGLRTPRPGRRADLERGPARRHTRGRRASPARSRRADVPGQLERRPVLPTSPGHGRADSRSDRRRGADLVRPHVSRPWDPPAFLNHLMPAGGAGGCGGCLRCDEREFAFRQSRCRGQPVPS